MNVGLFSFVCGGRRGVGRREIGDVAEGMQVNSAFDGDRRGADGQVGVKWTKVNGSEYEVGWAHWEIWGREIVANDGGGWFGMGKVEGVRRG